MKNTLRLLLSALLVIVRFLLLPIVAIVVGLIVWIVFRNWVVPAVGAGIVFVLFSVNLIRPRNYTLIAQNVAHSYQHLKENYSKVLDTEEMLLLATGIVASSPYITKNRVSLIDIANALKYAKLRQVYLLGSRASIYKTEPLYGRVGPAEIQSYMTNQDLFAKQNTLFDFILNIEALELRADNSSGQITSRDIIQTVIDAKDKTYKAIANSQKGSIPFGIIRTADAAMSAIDPSELRNVILRIDGASAE